MPKNPIIVYFFYNDNCPHCHKILPFIKSLRQKYKNVNFQILEVHYNKQNMYIFNAMNKKLGETSSTVPEVIAGNHVILGSIEIPAKLEDIIKGMI